MINQLKPVVFVKGAYGYTAQNTTQQILLLKALRITQDPKKLRDMIHVKTVADVYRTLDKIAMRKEYHASLAKAGISFDYIVGNIKKEIDTADKSTERLMAINILMKSIGMDKYEETAIGGGSWEEALSNISKEQKKEQLREAEYEVVVPPMPEDVRKKREKEKLDGMSLYE
jgi:hypothetical protein